jgi:8-oxo-dGTP pyrophosphatase MutT (NUDIX family)
VGYVADLRKVVGTAPLIVAGAAIVVLNKQNQVLLGRRTDNGFWSPPAGSMELGESLEQTARRELFEETGLEARDLKLLTLFSGKAYFYEYPHGDQIYNVAAIYLTRDVRGSLVADGLETKELRYFDLQDLPTENGPFARALFRLLQEKFQKGEL